MGCCSSQEKPARNGSAPTNANNAGPAKKELALGDKKAKHTVEDDNARPAPGTLQAAPEGDVLAVSGEGFDKSGPLVAASPRLPANAPAFDYGGNARLHAEQQFTKLLLFVHVTARQRGRQFARWAPFQQKYEEYLFTDVLRTLEIHEENDIMSVDDASSDGGSTEDLNRTLGEITLDLEEFEEPPSGWLPELIANLKRNKEQRVLPPESVYIYVMKKVTELFKPLESVVHINVPENGRLIVVGDLHGQLDDLLWVLAEGNPSETTHYLFNGDFVDRGPDQCEVLLLLYGLKMLYPSSVWLNRGNHEEHRVNKNAGKDGFMATCIGHYSDHAYKAAQLSFKSLPLCHIVNNKIAVLHGGLPEDKGVTLSEMRKINRFNDCPTSKNKGRVPPSTRAERIFQAILWSDPRDMKPRTAHSSRGAGVWYSKDVTNDFLKTNGLSTLIRSHEVTSLGHKAMHDGRCITVFSASRYCGKDDNRGAYLVLLPNLDISTSEYFIRQGKMVSLREKLDNQKTEEESIKEMDAEAIRKLAIRRLGELIFARRSQLLGLFQQKDPDRGGEVSKKTWIIVMKSCIGEDLPWYSLARHLVEVEDNGKISYIRFLERFQNKLATNFMKSWAERWMRYGRSHITKCAVDMRRMLKRSEHKKDPKLSYHEVCQALRKSIPGLSMTEIYYLLAHMDQNGDGFLDADEWASEMEADANTTRPIPGILDIWDLRRTNSRKYEAFFKDVESKAGGRFVPIAAFVKSAMQACGARDENKSGWDLTAEYESSEKGSVDLDLLKEMVQSLEDDRH
eukprot:gene19444-29961_t